MSINAAIDELMTAMREQGIEPSDPLKMDGTLERFHVMGDRKGSTNGWAKIHLDAKPAGSFGCMKRYGDHKFSWKAKRDTKPMSAADLKAQREDWARRKAEQAAATEQRHADAAARAQTLWNAAQPAPDNHPYLVRKGVKAHGLRMGVWELMNKATGEIFNLTQKALYVPLCDKTRTVHSLQGIFPSKIMGQGDGARDKDYLKDGAKRGLFHAIGKPQQFDGRPVFIICEGYATGATLHEATNHLVLVTFDTSNLLPVAEAIRESKPDAIILFAADNDQWTVTQHVTNPGLHFARDAAKEVGGLVALPPFAHSDGTQNEEGKWSGPTDFNDLAVRDGNAAVAAIIEAALTVSIMPANEPEYLTDAEMPWDDEPVGYSPAGEAAHDLPPADMPPAEAPPKAPKAPKPPADGSGDHDHDELVNNAHFSILGYDGPTYYLFQHEKRQIMSITKSDLSDIGLIELADLYWWEMNFNNGKGGIDRKAVAQWLFRKANDRGIYDPSRIRGRGAWRDKDRNVYHHGSYLTVNGVKTEITKIKSGYVYPMAFSLPDPADVAMTDEEGGSLVDVASMVRWSMPGSAALMSGWVMLASICGALGWRPHIWLTGPAGSGKSTVQSKFCAALLGGGIGQYYSGDSTEPGIRQDLKADALPVLIDEAESNNEKDKQRLENVIGLIRKTSTESQMRTAKGTVSGISQHFQIRSMFCLASINVNLPTKADVDRLTMLVINAPVPGEVDRWPELEVALNAIEQDETISQRLLARALNLMPVILESITVFRRAAAKHFGDQRYGDQFGTLLAGAWCLMNSYVPSEGEALVLIRGYKWDEHTEDKDQDDSAKALGALLGAKIRMPGVAGDQSVYDLVRESVSTHRLNIVDQSLAELTLRRHGIIVDPIGGKLLFGTGVPNLKELIAKMTAITDLRGQLMRLNGAERVDKAYKFNGHPSKVISLPLWPILGDALESDELPI